jgi:hypothetical protein
MSPDLMFDFVCEWCGKDLMDGTSDDDFQAITLHGPKTQNIELCKSCYITAIQSLQFGKEVVQDWKDHQTGRRIYVAVESVGQHNELVNALVWPNTLLADNVESARKRSVTYRASQELLG